MDKPIMDAAGKFYITTPIYYVNDKPHIGHAYTTILADVLARYHREKKEATFFLTGTDEHGQKVQQAAEERGIAPKKHCDEMVVYFKQAWQKLEISHDRFIRTTDDYHIKVVQQVLQDLYDKGEIYASEYGGYYCVGCERFYTEKELIDGKCPQHQKEPDYIKEKNYFFRMSDYQQWLIDYINTHPEFIQPEHRKNEVLGFLKQPLNDLCISRPKSRLSWGIELPFDKDYVTYVWFDALLNYVTGIGYKQQPERFDRWWPADYHLIGKDIVTTHCVYWPTMMKAMEIPLPNTIFAHGWWMMDQAKMSKSLRNIVSPLDLIDLYGVDSVRYYLIRDMVLGQDANFSEKLFIERYNAELANDFGNLASRVATLIHKNFDSVIPQPGELNADDEHIIEQAEQLPPKVHRRIDQLDLNKASDAIITFIRAINKYMEIRQPWKLVKKDKSDTGTVLYIAAEGLRIAARLLHPIMPGKINGLLENLPINETAQNKFNWGLLQPGQKLGEFKNLFPRIKTKQPPAPKPKEKPQKMEEENQISIDQFAKLKLRTAKVVSAEAVPKTDKLLKLQIDTGKDQRQIVAGIAKHYDPQSLIGKTIVIVANLKPVKIRGIESQGMLLAAQKDQQLSLLTTLDNMDAGAQIS